MTLTNTPPYMAAGPARGDGYTLNPRFTTSMETHPDRAMVLLVKRCLKVRHMLRYALHAWVQLLCEATWALNLCTRVGLYRTFGNAFPNAWLRVAWL